MVFRHYIAAKLQKLLLVQISNNNFKSFEKESLDKLMVLDTDALICLRLAIKVNEKQIEMYSRKVQCNLGYSSSFVYKHLLAEIMTSVLKVKDLVFGPNFNPNESLGEE